MYQEIFLYNFNDRRWTTDERIAPVYAIRSSIVRCLLSRTLVKSPPLAFDHQKTVSEVEIRDTIRASRKELLGVDDAL